MKKIILSAFMLLAYGTSQAATLTPNTVYDMQIVIDATAPAISPSSAADPINFFDQLPNTYSCFTFGNCVATTGTFLSDNDNDAIASNGSSIDADGLAGTIKITTTDDNAGGVTFTVNSFNMDTYVGTAGGMFGTFANNVNTMSGSVDAAGNITYDPTGRFGVAQFFIGSIGEQPWNTAAIFTSGQQVNAVADITGIALQNDLTATIVSASTVGSAWAGFAGTPYTEIYSLQYVLRLSGNDDSINIDQGTANNTLSVLSNDLPASGLSITSIDTASTQGTVNNFTPGDTTLDYNPPADLTLQTDTINYTVTNGTDSLSATVTITLIDKTNPVIVLIGTDPTNIANGNPYAESGANCTDNFDPTKPALIAGDPVNTSIDATYVVTYNCSDIAGNIAAEVTRDVIVSTSDLPPVISINGADPLDVIVTSGDSNSFTQAIANSDVSCTDDRDTPTLTNDALTVDTSTLGGPFTITYNCSDSVPQNATPKFRDINVVDNIDPVVVAVGSNPTNIVVGNSYVEQGANCTDNFDTSPTLVITPDENTVDTSAIGISTTITYTCTDSSSNNHVATIEVVTISTGPQITLNGDANISLFLGKPYTEEGATCDDDIDASKDALISGDTVDTSLENTYTVRYNCSDSDGNNATEVTRTIIVSQDIENPVITLNGLASTTINKDFNYFEEGAVCSDNADADKTATIGGDTVDPTTPGTYSVNYSCTDSAGHEAIVVIRTITVNEEVTPASTSTADPNDDEIGSIDWLMLASFIGLIAARRRKI